VIKFGLAKLIYKALRVTILFLYHQILVCPEVCFPLFYATLPPCLSELYFLNNASVSIKTPVTYECGLDQDNWDKYFP